MISKRLASTVAFLLPVLVVAVVALAHCCQGFVSPGIVRQQKIRDIICHDSSESNDEKDLFDYFDPLRSPHEYPNGIGPDLAPRTGNEDDATERLKFPAGLDILASEFPSAFAPPPEDNLLRSGSVVSVPTPEFAPEVASSESTVRLDESQKKFSSSNNSAGTRGSSSSPSALQQERKEEEKEQVDLFDVFDPTLSPHKYPNGIPSTDPNSYEQQRQATVGILLMDHGSRNPASNKRLHALAALYQEYLSPSSNAIVMAAHMEIAEPTIPRQLEAMIDQGVTEIICHPYFLSPGRHVQEDIPEIVQNAIRDLNIEIPLEVTKPVGSSTDLMIHAIHALVEQSATTVIRKRSSGGKLGF